MKRRITGFSIMLLAAAVFSSGCYTYEYQPVVATATDLNTDEAGVMDSIFVREALREGWRQILIGRVGLTHSQNQDVKLLAERIVDDYANANANLKLIALRQNIPVAPPANLTDDSYPYRNLNGDKFDQMYLREIIRKGRDTVVRFKSVARNAQNTDVRDFAGQNLPVLEEHIRIAMNIASLAALNIDVNEPAGSLSRYRDPFYFGDDRRPHQFSELNAPAAISSGPSLPAETILVPGPTFVEPALPVVEPTAPVIEPRF